MSTAQSALDFKAKSLTGEEVDLAQYKGKVVLIVNTASKCGFTSQYKGLEQLWKTYQAQGLVVLGFPCNQFGKQEPGTSEQIQTFCEQKYGVTFPLFEKIDVNGDSAHPLFQYLKIKAPGLLGTESIKWNFTKFLVDRKGQVVERFASKTTPAAMTSAIEALLSAQP